MATTQELAGAADRLEREAEPEAGGPRRSERARVRAYLDLWERHIAITSVEGPIRPGRPLRV